MLMNFVYWWLELAYLEISQRAKLLNERCKIISDLLDMLREDIGNSNMTRITWIIIWLIVVAVFVAIVCICLLKSMSIFKRLYINIFFIVG